ncbi:PAS domain S-box protein [Aquincola sp. S2]|uniref:histidine kinase n=1 Tax=Pseudaquabacterium terrae TaxID=2732868 RepID=A0ABX2EG78_9BURK|nr:PAS domain S-box protein [Aquabacterium terrae]NRF67591.1 PAS domain S-box protein [Aquabacterium terrae]
MTDDERELRWADAGWGRQAPALPALDPALTRLLLEHIATRVAVIGRDGRYAYANHGALEFMGLPAERVIGRHMSEVLDEGVYRSFAPIFERLFAGESVHLSGWVNYEKQGRRYREQILVPYQPGGGPVQSVVVFGLDRTDQRLSEQELALRDEQLRLAEALKSAIVDHAQAALISSDAEGRIVEFNPAAEAMFGRPRLEAIGRSIGETLVAPRLRAEHEAGLLRMRAGGPSHLLGKRVELHAMRADGSEFPIEMVLWRTDVGGTVFYTASITDVSERQRAAQEIERQREALRQSERLTAMGGLLAGVAHELNNPLAIVMGRATLLEEKCADRADLLKDARQIREAADRCGRIVRTFLNMARSRPSAPTRVLLNDVARAAAELLAYTYRSHSIELRLDLDAALPAIQGDEDQIAQIVLNLLVNAQHVLAQRDGERRVLVRTGVTPDDGKPTRAWLRVADSGPGVAPDVRARLFEPFFTTKPQGLGTGLGLSVSRTLARKHGGDLELEHSDAGAVFLLSLPLAASAPAPSAPA